MPESINADFGRLAVVHTADVDWQPSPSPSVWRKRLDLTGAVEASRVTSVVRYDPDSAFHSHPHPDGEEILVLDGVFSDEHGDYPTGTYLLNPEGFTHAPFSKPGCVLFVKLRQYPGLARKHVELDTNRASWQSGALSGVEWLTLYEEDGYPETMRLVRLAPGAETPRHDHPGGEEIFVIDGDLNDGNGRYRAGSWVRYPPGSSHQVHTEGGCTLYVKSGHLGG
jgi:anti-sigma factor ChrR (cupin superfamily)